MGLTLIFDRVLDARTADGLDRTAKLIAGQVALAPDGALILPREPPDSRFSAPYGGLYWQVQRQVEQAGGTALRSRSLWDRSLGTVPNAAGEPAVGDLAGPDGGRLIAVTRRVSIPANGATVALAVTVAEDRRDLAESRATFLRLLVPSLGALFVALTLAMSLFVRRALSPSARCGRTSPRSMPGRGRGCPRPFRRRCARWWPTSTACSTRRSATWNGRARVPATWPTASRPRSRCSTRWPAARKAATPPWRRRSPNRPRPWAGR
ncbi:hypothetical protein GCM10025880_16990 [Methylorubrum aminovorans]|nr:hypothetical protein GCM10025880_16990 [Methylorubrum aminovorans]